MRVGRFAVEIHGCIGDDARRFAQYAAAAAADVARDVLGGGVAVLPLVAAALPHAAPGVADDLADARRIVLRGGTQLQGAEGAPRFVPVTPHTGILRL